MRRFLLEWADISARESMPEERKSTNWHDAAVTRSTSRSNSWASDKIYPDFHHTLLGVSTDASLRAEPAR
jgi:hypothetical protein